MRIALVHSFYRSTVPSGENVAVLAQAQALTRAGHDVLVIARHTDDGLASKSYALRSAFTVATGRGPDPLADLRSFDPDVVHVHNLFPNFGTRWLTAWPGPLVATLHNYRPLCANGLLFRDGCRCTDCISGGPLNALRHSCYQGSRVATLPLAIRQWRREPLLERADLLLVLSDRARETYAAAEPALADRLQVVPNGLEDRWRDQSASRSGWIFVGRVSQEKGLSELLRQWPAAEPLTILGEGPAIYDLRRASPAGVDWPGSVDQDEVQARLGRSLGLVFPGLCLEGATPLVVIEALMTATPIIALQSSAAADLVSARGCGRVYHGPSDLLLAMSEVRAGGESLRQAAREAYLSDFTVEKWVARLESAYHAVGAC
jgi:glycosyltransferase involved in cell wall biosynthesis